MKIRSRSKTAVKEARLIALGLVAGVACTLLTAIVAPAKDAKGGAPASVHHTDVGPDMVRQVAPAMVRQVAPNKTGDDKNKVGEGLLSWIRSLLHD